MVTGASSGIGREIALGLASSGARVVLLCRHEKRGKDALAYVVGCSGNPEVELLLADLSSQRQIREAVSNFRSRHDRLHVLVNNAGLIMDRRLLTEDGIEMTFAVNYLAYFLLTALLVDVLKSSAPSRVVNLTSAIYRGVRLDLDDLQSERRYNRDLCYARSKVADVLFTFELARRLEGTGITVNCVCPGAVSSGIWANSSRLMNMLFNSMVKQPAQGAVLPLHLALSPEMEDLSGMYFETRQHFKGSTVNILKCPGKLLAATCSMETAGKLWDESSRLTGLSTL